MRRLLVLLSVACLLIAGISTANAYFTADTSVPDNIIRAGTVEVSVVPTSAALSIDALAPGGESERALTVTNGGELACDIIVTGAKRAGYTAFYEALTCRVSHEGTVVFDGMLSELRTDPVRLAAGRNARLLFAVGLPGTAGNDLAGDYVKVTLYVDAEQAH